jgi:hypothetical protein
MLIENRTILMTLAFAAVFLAGCGTKSNEAGAPDGESPSNCPTGTDLTTLMVPATVISDAGATLSGCASCAKSSCQAELGACNGDCLCQSEVGAFLACLDTGRFRFDECVTRLGFQSEPTGLPLSNCLQQNCVASCSPSSNLHAPDDASAGPCTTGKDITMIALPEAGIGDAGATVSGCIACAKASCQAQVAACNGECGCESSAPAFVECLATGTYSFGQCTDFFTFWIDPAGTQLPLCLTQSCASQCCTTCQ